MRHAIVVICFLYFAAANAQEKKKPEKVHFTSINQFGWLIGRGGESSSIQTINGASKKNWYAGVGTGIDFYGQRSIPLFIDLRRELFSSVNKPFIYADAGVHFQWLNFIQNESRGLPDARPGLYYDAGFGYNITLRKRTAFVLSAGYAFKRVKETFTSYRAPMINGVFAQTKDQRVSEYRRWAIRIGIKI